MTPADRDALTLIEQVREVAVLFVIGAPFFALLFALGDWWAL